MPVRAATLADQQRCAQMAQAKWDRELPHHSFDDYRNHYSEKLGKCLMQRHFVLANGKTIWITEDLIDAGEGSGYGAFISYEDVGGPVNVIGCNVGSTECHSLVEFDELVAPFMAN